MAVPLQKVKTFRNGESGNGWTNMLIFGENFQVLKTLLQMKQEEKMKNADGGMRLVYIDPPFGTRRLERASVQFLNAYIEKGNERYFVLHIPYPIIEEIHNRPC
jgi:predicted RNA methylase